MPRLALPLLGIVGALVVPALAQVPPPVSEPSGDQTSPALLEMIRKHLAGTSSLRPSDGVRIEESKFFRGSVRIRGSIVSETQRDALRRALESIRSRMEMAVDVKITSFDLSGLRIGPRPPTDQIPKKAPTPKIAEAPEEDDGVEVLEECPTFVVPYFYFMPPPAPPARKRCHFFSRCDDGPGGYGYPPPGMFYWYLPPPMPCGYGGFYYPH